MVEGVLLWLQVLANDLPLPFFVLVGGIVEEFIAPIPSPLVNGLAGSIAKMQGLGIPSLLWLCILSSIAKTAGTWMFYFLGDKLEDAVVPRFGKYIGVTHEDLEQFGKHFNGGWRDDIVLFVLRAIPVMPSTPVSLICGIININMRTYIVSTSAGFFVRNLFFMGIGYSGIKAANAIFEGFNSIESLLTALIVIAILLVLGWLYFLRKKVHPGTWLKKGDPPTAAAASSRRPKG